MQRRTLKTLGAMGMLLATLGASMALGSATGAAGRAELSSPASSGAVPAGSESLAAASTGIVPPENPSESLPPSPNFTDDGNCAVRALDVSDKCNTDVVNAIDNARSSLESMAPLSLNLSAFDTLTVPEQIFVITNLERTDRGLTPIAGLTAQLDGVAQSAAAANTDPNLSSSTLTGGAMVSSWGSIWAGGTSNALGSDYYWMYDDGLGSANGSCTSSSSASCWGHRDQMLGTFVTTATCGSSAAEQYMGAGDTSSGSSDGPSFTGIVVGACGQTPSDVVFTWPQAEQTLNGGGGSGTTTTTTTSLPTTTTTTTTPTTTTTTTSTTTTTTTPTTTTTLPTTTTTTTTSPAPAAYPPGMPQDVVAVSSPKKGVRVTWDAPAYDGGAVITGYEIFRSRASGTETLYREVACTSTTCTYTNTRALSNRMFYYTVSAVNAAGVGPSSREVFAKAR
jgi:hypothetical protein